MQKKIQIFIRTGRRGDKDVLSAFIVSPNLIIILHQMQSDSFLKNSYNVR